MRCAAQRILHADWSQAPSRRALVLAAPHGRGFTLSLGDPRRARVWLRAPGTLFAVDAPIGLPRAYARARGIRSFRAFLADLGPDDPFFEPIAPPDRPSLARPFYPARPGGATRAQLLEGLGLGCFEALLRECDRRVGAHALFWTLGPGQCGKAALSLWHELLRPHLAEVALWPFDGPLAELMGAGRPVVAETYPTLARRLLTLPRLAKRLRPARAALAPALKERARDLGAAFDPGLERELEEGFPRTGEHGFDALMGCLLALAVLVGALPSGEPDLEVVRTVEGWILGLVA